MIKNKSKILTFSYDDGVTQDLRLIELFNKYGMKATFNLNSERFGLENKSMIRDGVRISCNTHKQEDIKYIYDGHEVAAHTLNHPNLKNIEDDSEVIRQVEQDRKNLSNLVGYDVVGMAYPCGGECYDSRVINLIKNNTGIKYSRTTNSNFNFKPQTNLLEFNPTVYHHVEMDKMFELGEKFLSLKTDTPQIFFVWGHAYEFDIRNDWGRLEEFLQMMSGHDDIFYCTNKEALL